MNLPDLIAIATFTIAIMGVVYAFGQRDTRLSELEKDLNAIGQKNTGEFEGIEEEFKQISKRLNDLSIFYVRVDQRVVHIEERIIGEETSAHLRKMDASVTRDYSSIDEHYYSENSWIEL
jgi:hypothetical protein